MSAKYDVQPVSVPETGHGPSPSPSPIPVRHVVFNPQARICMECNVRRHSLFGVLELSALERIHGHIADLHVQPGQRLFSATDPGLAAFSLREGVVRLERLSERGERRIVRLAGRGDLIGLEAMLGQTYSADAVACTPVKVCRLPRVMIDDLAQGHPEVLRDLMKRWQAALDEADEWLTELSAGSARWRMLRLLLKISEFSEADGRVWLPSRQQMGAMLGMTVETASRLVSSLKREGVVLAADTGHARLAMPELMAALRALSDEH